MYFSCIFGDPHLTAPIAMCVTQRFAYPQHLSIGLPSENPVFGGLPKASCWAHLTASIAMNSYSVQKMDNFEGGFV